MASGFALRRSGSCLATEQECGATVQPYHACCPSGSYCPPPQYNVACCPTAANCTQALLPDPQCANAEWDLFDNGGYFCCLHGLAGYATPGNSDGCAEAGHVFQAGEQLLKTISTGRGDVCFSFFCFFFGSVASQELKVQIATVTATSTITSLPQSTTSSPLSNSITSPSPPPSTPSASPRKTGAIVGGSVGAGLTATLLALAAWFFVFRRRKRRTQQAQADRLEGVRVHLPELHPVVHAIHEKDSQTHVLELPTNIAHEKDSRSIFELPAVVIVESPKRRGFSSWYEPSNIYFTKRSSKSNRNFPNTKIGNSLFFLH